MADDIDRILAQWAAERPDLNTEAIGVFGRIFRLSKLAGDATERAYATFGIARADFDVIATLRRSGSPFQLSPGALAASMMLSSGGTTARLDRLEKTGLVARSPDPDDRRGILVRLTEKSGLAEVPELPHLMRALGHQTRLFSGDGGDMTFSASEEELRSFLFDVRRPGSLAATLARVPR